MINLEKHIREHREQLDGATPSDGHEERFLMKLQQQRQGKVHKLRTWLQIAASIAVILAAGFFVARELGNNIELSSNELPGYVREADDYYFTQVNQRYEQIGTFSFDSQEEKDLLLRELDDLECIHAQLMKDLEANPGDERIINALIRHYQLKLEVMDQIIVQLNQVKSEIQSSHEKENI